MTTSCPLSFTATTAGQGGGHAAGRLLTTVLATLAFAGCGGLDPVAQYEPITDPVQLYTSLTLDRRAIVLSTVAPYDTVQLTATPRNALGEPLEGFPTATFSLGTPSDSTKVTVTPDGLVKALAVTSNGVSITATLKGPGNVAHDITARINVNVTTDPPPQMASVSFDPVSPDSAKGGLPIETNVFDFNLLFFTARRLMRPGIAKPRALDALGNTIPGVPFEVTSLDPEIVPNGGGSIAWLTSPPTGFLPDMDVTASQPGQVRLVARTTVYGVTMADTVLYTVTYSVLQSVQAVTLDGAARFQPSEIRLPPFGIVFFQNTLGDSVDVTFDDTANVEPAPVELCDNMSFDPDTYGPGPYCEPGDALMPPPDPNNSDIPNRFFKTERLRQFPVPGVYNYHSTRTGATGRIVVTAGSD